MSKVDALRALREARQSAAVPTVSSGEVCGHRNMSGRSCTRPAGHAETSHRYAAKV